MEALLIALAVLAGIALIRFMIKRQSSESIVSNPNIEEIENLSELEAFFASTDDTKRLLYLHDPWCPVSGQATREVARLGHEFAAVDVSRHRDITREIERRTGIRHESPQAIVVANGQPIWEASHFGITGLALTLALQDDGDSPERPTTIDEEETTG